jgi:hypothetical protein
MAFDSMLYIMSEATAGVGARQPPSFTIRVVPPSEHKTLGCGAWYSTMAHDL